MKNFILISIVLFAFISTYSQSQRMVLAEEFTNASCGPCAGQNPAFDNLLQNNFDDVVALKYHTSWPGTDPMYSHNTVENAARTSYYDVSGVPEAVIDAGNGVMPININQTVLNNALAVPASFNITVNHRVSVNQDSIYVDMLIEATEDALGNLKAHIAVIEKTINFTNSPGSNGETTFNDVMKKMLPNHTGTTLPAFETGDYIIIHQSWELANVYDIDQLGVVAFIQNSSTKSIMQAARSSTDPLQPIYAYEATVSEIKNIPVSNCLGKVNPIVDITNYGSETLSSLDLFYKVNDGNIEEYNWTGNLNFLETESVILDEIQFLINEENSFIVNSGNPNGNQDEYIKNDTNSTTFLKAKDATPTILLFLRTDENPEQTTWEIVNSEGSVVHSGGPYTVPLSWALLSEPFELDPYECHSFIIYDEGGNGIQGSFGNGLYSIRDEEDLDIFQGGLFGAKETVQMNTNNTSSINIIKNSLSLKIIPNPFTDNTTIEFEVGENSYFKLEVYDNNGALVFNKDLGQFSEGYHKIPTNFQYLAKGVYQILLISEKTILTNKMIVR